MKIYEYFIDENNLYIISEFCDEGDLLGKMKKLNKMSELVVKYLMSQILDALLYYLHCSYCFFIIFQTNLFYYAVGTFA